jgi:cytidyltransferase-like protein
VYAVGRFQPPTIGHASMIEAVMNAGGEAFVFVSSSTSPKAQNPLTVTQKRNALQKMFPKGVTFVDTSTCVPKCAGPVAANDYLRSLGYTDITLFAGSDREPIFKPTADMWKTGIANGVPAPKFKGLQRTTGDGAAAMSGTKARQLALEGKKAEFEAAVRVGSIDDAGIHELYDAIREAKKGGKKGGVDEELTSFDADMEGGKKTTRRRRGSTRKLSFVGRTRRRATRGQLRRV